MAEDDAREVTLPEALCDLADELRALRAKVERNNLLLTPPSGWAVMQRTTTANWDKMDLPRNTAFWILQNQAAGEAVRYAATEVRSGTTYGLIYAQGSISRTSAPLAVFFRRDGAAAVAPSVILEVAWWTDEQMAGRDEVRSVVQSAAARQVA